MNNLLNDPDIQLLSRHPPRQIDFVSLVQNFRATK
ncbi:hypothetical protein LCGC14_2580260, partial [marine sediment metagenome]